MTVTTRSGSRPAMIVPLALVGLVVMGLLAMTFWRRLGNQTPPDRPGVGEARVLAPEPVLNPMASPGSGVGAISGAPPAQAISPDDPASMFARPVTSAERNAEQNRVAADLESKYMGEPVDSQWASSTESGLGSIVKDPGLQASGITPQGYAAACRSRTCRVSAVFRSSGEAEDWSLMYVTLTGGSFGETRSLVMPNGNGGFEARVYGYRR